MDLLSVIRRWHFRQGIPIREIKRRTGLSRNTIRKYLRADAVEPVFRVPRSAEQVDPFAEKLTGWLKVELGRAGATETDGQAALLWISSCWGMMDPMAAWPPLRGIGSESASMSSRPAGAGTFVPLVFQPGEAFQFDWS
jgi:hypothetical protein